MTVFRRPSGAAAAGDPIPFAHDGELHLFHLSSPHGTRDYPERVRTTWQHAVSADLRHWRELPPAVEPGPPGSYDAGGIWTGSVVEHEGTFFLFYTAHDPGAAHPQTIALATSTDLVTFAKHPDNPILLPPAGFEPVDWRDPYVFFHEGEGRWWMLLAARTATGPHWRRGCIALATSTDLLTWAVEPEPLYVPGTTFCPECPELWEDHGTWYLVYSRFSERVGTIVRVADSARGPFRVPAREDLGGRRWYAAKSAPWRGERAFFGWVHDAVEQPDGARRWLWGGDFALPRLARPGDTPTGRTLAVRPAVPIVGELTQGPALVEVATTLGEPGRHQELTLTDPLPPRVVLQLVARPGDAAGLGFDLRDAGDDTAASSRFSLDLRTGHARLTREPQPLDDFWADLTGRSAQYREVDGPVLAETALAQTAPGGTAPEEGAITVTAVIDGEVAEIYVDDEVALTHRLTRPDVEGDRLTVFALDGAVELRARVWRMA